MLKHNNFVSLVATVGMALVVNMLVWLIQYRRLNP